MATVKHILNQRWIDLEQVVAISGPFVSGGNLLSHWQWDHAPHICHVYYHIRMLDKPLAIELPTPNPFRTKTEAIAWFNDQAGKLVNEWTATLERLS